MCCSISRSYVVQYLCWALAVRFLGTDALIVIDREMKPLTSFFAFPDLENLYLLLFSSFRVSGPLIFTHVPLFLLVSVTSAIHSSSILISSLYINQQRWLIYLPILGGKMNMFPCRCVCLLITMGLILPLRMIVFPLWRK